MHAYIHIHRVLPTTKKQDSLLFSYSTHAAFVPIGIFDESGKKVMMPEMFWLGLFTTREMTQMQRKWSIQIPIRSQVRDLCIGECVESLHLLNSFTCSIFIDLPSNL